MNEAKLQENTVALLNTIRANATESYQDRIPLATQQNITNVGTAILSYDVTKNEFLEALVNRIGLVIIQNKTWKNPLQKFKKGTLPYGKDIEEIFVDIIKAQTFDPSKAENEVFKRELPNVKAIFHRLDRQDFYKTTVSDEQIKLAFTSTSGVYDLVSRIINALYNSDEVDEYLLMKQLLVEYGQKDLFYKIHSEAITDETSAKSFLVQIRAWANRLKFMSDKYNAEGVTTFTNPMDLVIFMTPETQAYVDVEALARAFNIDKADFIGNVVTVDDFGALENVVAIAVDKEMLMVYDKLFQSRTQYNSQGLYYNVFFHHWEVLSTSRFANALLFTTDTVTSPTTPTVTEVSITNSDTTVQAGNVVLMKASVTGTNNVPTSVAWSISGQTKADTSITQDGLLKVSTEEPTSTHIVVTATSTYDTSKSNSKTLTVTAGE